MLVHCHVYCQHAKAYLKKKSFMQWHAKTKAAAAEEEEKVQHRMQKV